ncbi:sigma-54 dependent transcriptional regulator [uncultured Xylophilus sp.]|uniref:sigma-54-dependent transcriptional regulator n=1 Tax=uncultured Xylophilus sp. TaxID=296832 RepID=UPI0025F63ACB|nr:sigma-54 dependent transcriptional regulator [uncultured Xylophilus sp.]
MIDDFKIVFVEDDPAVRTSLTQTLELAGLAVEAFGSAELALRSIGPGMQGIVVSDIRLGGMDGLELLRRVVAVDADIPVILITAHGDVMLAVSAMRAGAYDFLEKPFAPDRLVDIARRAIEKRALQVEVQNLRQQLGSRDGIESMLLGRSTCMSVLRQQILQLAPASVDVMLLGETGTGKELVARCLHQFSPRRSRNFVAINCGGVPESLLESELFGHEAGAFTHAARKRIGKIEYADGGTLLLDEIESMPPSFQVKLLRVLQERKVERLGSNDEIEVDVRVVAASKIDLSPKGPTGHEFRSDLYYRLNVAVVHLPALRERREDVPLLFEHFALQAAARHGRDVPTLTAAQLQRLVAHDWPGNVRELRNAAERFVLGLQGDDIAADTASVRSLAEQMDQVEKALIEQALRLHRGRPVQVSEALGIARKTFYDKIARHAIVLDDYRIEP